MKFALLGALACVLLVGCGKKSDASHGTPSADPKTPPTAAAIQPVNNADGTQVLAFRFEEETPCGGCVGKVREALATLPGVKKNDATPGTQVFTVEFDPKATSPETLVNALYATKEVTLKVQ
ncbi:MAG TPA: heavy-metal-associated domain-containing protein [Planctomycetota bacterium]|nr:heavy-metal-associated domain-containing protein [Planctomycetota bacterium]